MLAQVTRVKGTHPKGPGTPHEVLESANALMFEHFQYEPEKLSIHALSHDEEAETKKMDPPPHEGGDPPPRPWGGGHTMYGADE